MEKDYFGESPKPAREARALPVRTCGHGDNHSAFRDQNTRSFLEQEHEHE